jgi:threonyl-tRNA synthetase
MKPAPAFFDHRIKMFEEMKAEYDEWLKSAFVETSCLEVIAAEHRIDQPRQEITITMPDGSERKGTSYETSPMDVAKEISKSLADRIVIAKVRN